MATSGSNDSDAALVERIRDGIARYDRLRWALGAVYVILTVAFFGLVASVSAFVRDQLWPAMGPGFLVGLSLGSSLGLLAVKIGHGLLTALTTGGRAERLLVRYHDTLRALEVEQEG
jgi:hypothetical protein